jgi:hypothetical protein
MQISHDRLAKIASLSLPDMKLEVLDLYDEDGSGAGTMVQISFTFESW